MSTWLPEYYSERNLRLKLEEDFERALSFSEDGTPLDGSPALNFDVRFATRGKITSFEFNEEEGVYNIRQYNRAFIDGNCDTEVAVTNVLILRMAISGMPGDREGRLNIRTTGSGTGYFVNGGEYVEIEWSREDNESQFVYTLMDGSELILGQGQTYICIVPNAMEINFSSQTP